MHINDFRGVRARCVKRTGYRSSDRNAQVKGQQLLWHSFVYLNVCHHNGATIATIVATIVTTSKQLGTNSNRLFRQVSSIHLIQTAKLIPNFQMKPDTYFITQMNILFAFQISMCDKSRNTWLCVHWQWNTPEWCQLNALQASPVVHLVTPLSCVSLSMNTQPSVPTIKPC